MAEKKPEKEPENEAGEKPKKSLPSKKGIIIISVVVVLAIALSVAATLFLLGGGEEDAEAEAGTETAEEGHTSEAEAPVSGAQLIYLALNPPFVVTFNVGGRQRYMQINLSVASRSQQTLDALTHHMPLIRSRLLTAYSKQDFTEVQTDAGKQSLQSLTVSVVNEVLNSEKAGKIENAYFTNLVLQ